ncbi:MAG: hypothetical protein WCC72_06790 [Dehalococcoidales bacterium]|jgi:hypothetical protein
MKYRIKTIIGLMLLLVMLAVSVGCGNSTTTPYLFPPFTTRNVQLPAPVPWSNIPTYTEQTYEIHAKVGEEFAIGMFATMQINFGESNDQSFINEEDDQMVPYKSGTINMYGTEWFMFKAIKKGVTEISFNYPLEYTKVFKISIN